VSAKPQWMRHLFQARLSRRIVLWVFLSIVLIEAVILLPSIYRRQQELLAYLKNLASARVEGGLVGAVPASDEAVLARLEQLVLPADVRGGTLYRLTGELVGTFGEPPELTFASVQQNPQATIHRWQPARYDAAWSIAPLADQYVLIIRHDATSVHRELLAFLGRIAGLVTIISIFVTGATWIGLEPALITPILLLRSDLLKAGHAVQQDQSPPEFDSLSLQRHDELGDVIAAFDQMYEQVSAAISERRQAERALRQSEEKFAKAFHSSPSALLISTLETGRLIEVNDSFLHLYGSTLEEVIGRSALELNLWDSPQSRDELIQKLQQDGAVRNLEYTFRTKTGELRAILFSAELIQIDGEACLVSVANDITERKQAEKALERLAEIGELAAMIVHEVRNPLTTVLMGLESFRQLQLSARDQQRLNLALEEADRLQRLLNEILQYARCQTLQTSPLDVNALMQDLLDSVRTQPWAANRTIEFLPASAPVYILGDRDKLKQVLINLTDNACEASPEGGQVRCSIVPCEHRVCLHIYNGGAPIPADVLPRLTQPFFTTKSTGNGLGLAIVKRIVEAHQGELIIESSAAIGGTRVSVILPTLCQT